VKAVSFTEEGAWEIINRSIKLDKRRILKNFMKYVPEFPALFELR